MYTSFVRCGTVVIMGVFFWAIAASAGDLTIRFDGDSRASMYRVYMSEDNGATWAQTGNDIPQPVPLPEVVCKQVTALITVPDTGLILLRASALNSAGEQKRFEAGAWFNAQWSPLRIESMGVR